MLMKEAVLSAGSQAQLERPKIAISGASGRIGSRLVLDLAQLFQFREFHLLSHEEGQIQSFLHLAANPNMEQPWPEVLRSGVEPILKALEIARQSKIPHFVYASSCFVVDMQKWRSKPLIPTNAPPDPQTAYGLGKAWGEALCRFYAKTEGLSVDVLRIGWVIDLQEKRIFYPIALDVYCHAQDLFCLVQKLFQVKRAGFHCYYAVSAGTRLRWDLEEAAKEVGHRPRRHLLFHATPWVIRDYLRRLPGILYRGLRATLRNRFQGRPVSTGSSSEDGRTQVQLAMQFPKCDHPADPAFLRTLDRLYVDLEEKKGARIDLSFVQVDLRIEDEMARATQTLFWEMALLVVQFFQRQNQDIEVTWRRSPL